MKIMKKFIQYYKPYKTVFFLDMICAMIISLIDLAFPQILNYLNDTLYIADHQTIIQSLFWLAIFLLIMYAIRALCKYYVSAQGHIMGAQMERDMRKDLFDKFEQLSFSYYDRNNTGEMMSKLVSDLFDICEFAHHGPENVFISLLKIIGSFILLMYIHVPLTILLMIVTLCMLLFSLKQNKSMQQTFMDNRQKIAGVNASLQDTLAGIRVVKSFANEDIERHKFARSNERFLQSKKNNYHCMGKFQGGNNFFQGLLYVTILVAGGFFIAEGSLEPVALATYALYINIFITPIEVLVEFTEMLQKGYSGFKRFNEVMETQVEIQDAPDSHDLVNVQGVIDYKDVSFGYDDEKVLDKYKIKDELEKLNNNKIWLKCGSYIVIDKTEALTSIDVNSGKYTGKENLENTILRVNEEATVEIAKQIRLRDMSGIIIIDYIDMGLEENKHRIMKLLEQEVKKDRAKVQIEGFTRLNLLEMTRKQLYGKSE